MIWNHTRSSDAFSHDILWENDIITVVAGDVSHHKQASFLYPSPQAHLPGPRFWRRLSHPVPPLIRIDITTEHGSMDRRATLSVKAQADFLLIPKSLIFLLFYRGVEMYHPSGCYFEHGCLSAHASCRGSLVDIWSADVLYIHVQV